MTDFFTAVGLAFAFYGLVFFALAYYDGGWP